MKERARERRGREPGDRDREKREKQKERDGQRGDRGKTLREMKQRDRWCESQNEREQQRDTKNGARKTRGLETEPECVGVILFFWFGPWSMPFLDLPLQVSQWQRSRPSGLPLDPRVVSIGLSIASTGVSMATQTLREDDVQSARGKVVPAKYKVTCLCCMLLLLTGGEKHF